MPADILTINYVPIMKKTSLFLLICGVIAVMCMGCESINNTDPTHDTTKLWPAYDNATDKWGYINAKGKMVIPAQFDEANGFSCGYAVVKKSGQWHYIDNSEAIQYSIQEYSDYYAGYNYNFYYGYVTVPEGDKIGLMNSNFEYTIQPGQYLGISRMSSSGLVAVRLYDELDYGYPIKWGYADANGGIVIPCQCYSDLNIPPYATFKDGYAVVSIIDTTDMGKKMRTVFDENGNCIIKPTSYYLKYVGGDMFAYQPSLKTGYGILNKQGEVLCSPGDNVEYSHAVDNSLIPVRNGDMKWGYMNFSCNMQIGYLYDYALPFYEGYAFVENTIQDGKFEDEDVWKYTNEVKVIDTDGEVVYTLPKYSTPETGFHNGLALITQRDGEKLLHKYITPKGKTVYEWTLGSVIEYYSPIFQLSDKNNNEYISDINTTDELTEQTLCFSSECFMRRHAKSHDSAHQE